MARENFAYYLKVSLAYLISFLSLGIFFKSSDNKVDPLQDFGIELVEQPCVINSILSGCSKTSAGDFSCYPDVHGCGRMCSKNDACL